MTYPETTPQPMNVAVNPTFFKSLGVTNELSRTVFGYAICFEDTEADVYGYVEFEPKEEQRSVKSDKWPFVQGYVPEIGDIIEIKSGHASIYRKAKDDTNPKLPNANNAYHATTCIVASPGYLNVYGLPSDYSIGWLPETASSFQPLRWSPFSDYPIPDWKEDVWDELWDFKTEIADFITDSIVEPAGFYCAGFDNLGIDTKDCLTLDLCEIIDDEKSCGEQGITSLDACVALSNYLDTNAWFRPNIFDPTRSPGTVIEFEEDHEHHEYHCSLKLVDPSNIDVHDPSTYRDAWNCPDDGYVTTSICTFIKPPVDTLPICEHEVVFPRFILYPKLFELAKDKANLISAVFDVPVALPNFPAGIPFSKFFQLEALPGLVDPSKWLATDNLLCSLDVLGLFPECH